MKSVRHFLFHLRSVLFMKYKEVTTYQIKAPVQWGVTTTSFVYIRSGWVIKAPVQWGVTTTSIERLNRNQAIKAPVQWGVTTTIAAPF